MMERRYIERALTADGGKLVGYAAVFDSDSKLISERGRRFVETIAPGAFSRSLAAGRDVLALWHHDMSRPPLARTAAGTLRLTEDAVGLRVEIDPPAWAADIVESVRRGDVRGMSFSANVAKGGDAWTQSAGLLRRRITGVELLEVSITPTPAYAGTDIAVRNLTPPDPAAAARARVLARLR